MKRVFAVLPFLYAGLIWYLSSRQGNPPSDTFQFWEFFKDSLHLIEFGILYWLIFFAFAAHGRFTRGVSIAAIFVCILYGGIDEIHQLFTPLRSSTWIDLLKDAIGVLLSYYLIQRYQKRLLLFIGGTRNGH
ncbi:VanZ family protein [Metabacillus sp. GX 13764]|uniref:VanZ family protein n=1 Tax=Metabacillus kandeliae TaxID=2900151 RepID=UPI001E62472C|nr:VanZ family protein [Metabacillus kandeliae]MCD7034638.1 VanZ family protein [Metabacillus kandeliae]